MKIPLGVHITVLLALGVLCYSAFGVISFEKGLAVVSLYLYGAIVGYSAAAA